MDSYSVPLCSFAGPDVDMGTVPSIVSAVVELLACRTAIRTRDLRGRTMLDHIILTVSDVERSLAFYEAALKPLNIKFGARDNISPRARAEYYPGYYAADIAAPRKSQERESRHPPGRTQRFAQQSSRKSLGVIQFRPNGNCSPAERFEGQMVGNFVPLRHVPFTCH
jgi:catechol 2,3-dioxygenase-like lactoylglutathione lyase family enzyme